MSHLSQVEAHSAGSGKRHCAGSADRGQLWNESLSAKWDRYISGEPAKPAFTVVEAHTAGSNQRTTPAAKRGLEERYNKSAIKLFAAPTSDPTLVKDAVAIFTHSAAASSSDSSGEVKSNNIFSLLSLSPAERREMKIAPAVRPIPGAEVFAHSLTPGLLEKITQSSSDADVSAALLSSCLLGERWTGRHPPGFVTENLFTGNPEMFMRILSGQNLSGAISTNGTQGRWNTEYGSVLSRIMASSEDVQRRYLKDPENFHTESDSWFASRAHDR